MITRASQGGPPTDVAGYDPTRDAGDCDWDDAAAEYAAGFFPSCLTHVQGFSGPFTLQPWQADCVRTLFGWKRPDGTRRYREALVAVPRKNGKSAMCAGLGLYLLRCDGERGPQVYCAASTSDQATMVFAPAAAMVRQHPLLASRFRVLDTTRRIVCDDNGGFLRAIPAEAAQAHGFNASAVLYDELHSAPNRELYDVLKTSQGARAQSATQSRRGGPLFVSITTAGYDRHSICWEVWEYARKVRDGIIRDPYFLPVIYELRQDEDWRDTDVWRRVNPNFSVSISAEYLQEAYQRATELPSYENTFRNLHLNQWVEQATRWFAMDKWDACLRDVGDLYGCECWSGLDLSATTDLSAFVAAFPLDGRVALKAWFWVPGDAARDRERRDRVPYRQWIDEGWITATAGASVDYDRIRADIHEIAQRHKIKTIAIDRWNANQLAKQLEGDGFHVGYFGQGYASMSSPAKEFQRLLVDAQLAHDGNPVLRWMASNVAIEQDAAGNIKPSKARSTERIDGIVAAVMALGVLALEASPTWTTEEIGL